MSNKKHSPNACVKPSQLPMRQLQIRLKIQLPQPVLSLRGLSQHHHSGVHACSNASVWRMWPNVWISIRSIASIGVAKHTEKSFSVWSSRNSSHASNTCCVKRVNSATYSHVLSTATSLANPAATICSSMIPNHSNYRIVQHQFSAN